jgi:2-polyprenyl-3-methyl-5-hydroxy-6-metoxy-1,4-benzoquinol methylase
MFHFKNRSNAPEILDDFNLQGNDLHENLKELEKVNRFLGGNSILKKAFKAHLKPSNEEVKLLDIGCGGGDAVRLAAKWCTAHNRPLTALGIDANKQAIGYAQNKSLDFPNVKYACVDIFSKAFDDLDTDVYMFNLVLHHFEEADIIRILAKCKRLKGGIIINDLSRNVIAYHLFRVVSRILGFSYIGRHDGKLSVKKAFTKADWQRILAQAGIAEYQLSSEWAFRHLIIVPKP